MDWSQGSGSGGRDWLALWGVRSAVGFVFRSLFEGLEAEKRAQLGHELFAGCLDRAPPPEGRELLQMAAGKALQEFLQLVQEELEDAGAEGKDLLELAAAVTRFTELPEVREGLGNAFHPGDVVLGPGRLEERWSELGLVPLPLEYDWQSVLRRYRRKARALLQESAELRALLDSPTESGTPLANAGPLEPGQDLTSYRQEIRRHYSTLPGRSHDASAAGGELRRVFVPLSVRRCFEFLPPLRQIPVEHRRRLWNEGELPPDPAEDEIDELEARYGDQAVRDAVEVCENDHYRALLILGEPGSGKSVLLRYLLASWVEMRQEEWRSRPVRLFWDVSSCRTMSPVENLVDWLEEQGICGQPKKGWLRALLDRPPGALLLVDGLDELSSAAERHELLGRLAQLVDDFPRARVLVTCRLIGTEPWSLERQGFQTFLLQGFDRRQIRSFLERWQEAGGRNEVEHVRKREELRKALEASLAVRELARSPVLLAVLANLSQRRNIPLQPEGLYEALSRFMLEQWDVRGTFRDGSQEQVLDVRHKQAMLRRVAYEMRIAAPGRAGNLIGEEELESAMGTYLETIEFEVGTPLSVAIRQQAGLLCCKGGRSYAFVHQALFEYFCADDVVWRLEEDLSLSEADLARGFFGSLAGHPSWDGMLSLVAARLEPKLLRSVLGVLLEEGIASGRSHLLFLAARCLGRWVDHRALRSISAELRERVSDLVHFDLDYFYESRDLHANELVRKVRDRAVAARASIWKLDPTTPSWLTSLAQSDGDVYVRAAAIRELGRGFALEKETPVLLRTWAQSDQTLLIRALALAEYCRSFAEDPATLELLESSAGSDEEPLVRALAVEELARRFSRDPQTLPRLRGWAVSDDVPNVRATALRELARGFRTDPQTLPLIERSARSDRDPDVRRQAIEELAQGFAEHPATLGWLKEWAKNEESPRIRVIAVEQLGRCYRGNHQVRFLLRNWSQSDPDPSVRRAAVRELLRGYEEEAQALPMATSWVEADASSSVRREVVKEIGRGFKDEGRLVPLLRSWARGDRSSLVRAVALRELARRFGEDEGTLALVKQGAQFDHDAVVRTVAIGELARGFSERPEVRSLLQETVETDVDSVVRETAIKEIARNWKRDEETLPALRRWGQSDDDPVVRRAAMRELARGFPEDRESRSLLQQSASADPHPLVRAALLEELARGFRQREAIRVVVKDRAQGDDDPGVRGAAIRQLTQCWRDHPETLPILKTRALTDQDVTVRREAAIQLARCWKDDAAVGLFLDAL